jgi:mRNA interferase MazF
LTPERRFQINDILLIRFPFTDLSGDKLRPALVVAFAGGSDVVLAFVTSNLESPSDFDVVVNSEDPDFTETGLHQSSRIRLDRLATLDAEMAMRRIGKLATTRQPAIDAALRAVFRL